MDLRADASRLPPYSPRLLDLLVRAGDLQYAGRPEEALELYRQAQTLDRGNGYVLNQMGLALARLGRFDQAFDAFGSVLRRDPANGFARLWRGVLFLTRNESQAARADFEELTRREPQHGGAWYCLGVMALVERRRAEAARCLQRSRQGCAQDTELLVRLARAFLGLDMPANAELALRQALALDPAEPSALKLLGWLRHNQGLVDEALRLWRKVLQEHPQDHEARANLAKVLHEQALAEHRAGNESRARALWTDVLRVYPGHRAALHHLQAGRGDDTIPRTPGDGNTKEAKPCAFPKASH